MTLDPELNKLRNKELRFGCYVVGDGVLHICMQDEGDYIQACEVTSLNQKYRSCNLWKDGRVMDSLQHVLGTPLTRGRIEYLYVDLVDSKDIGELPAKVGGIRAELSTLFIENHKLLDQNELQRQQNEHRPELKALLKQFSDYI